jgi:uncharacterized membrane protein
VKVLLAGESWTTHQIHIKGRAGFTQGGYGEGASQLVQLAAQAGHTVEHLPNEFIPARFPVSVAELREYDVVVLSDLPSDSLLLDDRVLAGDPSVDRIQVLAEYVHGGGGLIMVGGYMSFSGHGGQARYGATVLADVLPVRMHDADDRAERPAGVVPRVTVTDHDIVAGLPERWPPLLGYNRLHAKPGATVAATVDADPLLVTGEAGAGRAVAYASDLSPHWASNAFMAWPGLGQLWQNLLTWAAGGNPGGAGTRADHRGEAARR